MTLKEKLQQAQQAESVAESLAAGGSSHLGGSSKSHAGALARDCPSPDRRGYKGKSKSKEKGKKGPWMQAHAMWSKGKGKPKGNSKERTVKACSSDLFLGGLELSGLEMATIKYDSPFGTPPWHDRLRSHGVGSSGSTCEESHSCHSHPGQGSKDRV